MKKLVSIIISLTLFTTLLAQDDTTVVTKDPSKGWNAMNYSLQKRYQPQGEAFESYKFTDNTFLLLGGNGTGFIGNKDMNPGNGVTFSAGYGKWFNRSHAVRAELGVGRYFRKHIVSPRYYGELTILHQFNLSSYLKGYREGRFCEISTVEGISGFVSKSGDAWSGGAAAHLGLDFTFRLSKRFDLYLEPIFSVYTPGVDPAIKEQWHKYDLSYKYTMGFRYNFYKDKSVKLHWQQKKVNGYMFYGGGFQIQNSDLVWNEVGVGKTLGPHAFAGVGSWIKDYFGIQGSLFYSNHIWSTYQDFGPMKAHYMGARIELVLDPLYLIGRKSIHDRRFTCPLVLGPELGFMNRLDVQNDFRTLYIGATFAIQPSFKITRNVEIFLQPRFSIVPYSVQENSLGGIVVRNGYFDGIMNLNIGFAYSL